MASLDRLQREPQPWRDLVRSGLWLSRDPTPGFPIQLCLSASGRSVGARFLRAHGSRILVHLAFGGYEPVPGLLRRCIGGITCA